MTLVNLTAAVHALLTMTGLQALAGAAGIDQDHPKVEDTRDDRAGS